MEIGIVGSPLDLGADRRGVDMGPSAIRYAGLEVGLRGLGHSVKDFGNVSAPVPESEPAGHAGLKYLTPIVQVTQQLANAVGEIVQAGYFPIILGGDHSVSLGSVSAVARNRTIGLIWLDAHGDFNVPDTTPSGNIHGMVLSALAGYGDETLVGLDGYQPKVQPQNIALVGVRNLDPGERDLLLSTGAHVFTMHDIDRLGLPAVMELAIERVSARTQGIHLSLDLDVVDPLQAPGVGTPVRGGLNFRETHLAMEMLAESGQLISMDAVEVNPVLDDHNQTADLAAQFILSALGKRIL